ncbi:hypothetical protein HYO65_gp237 [Tenacibaculum phage PTm1]|uniref:Uncharacterized protein n=2 Tax=Shirahamavirus PTm1 TaxID=2846435 RepID=A0A5S9ERV6_9CAUD|nr:hypothetical protein HYO65_gp237 [Tenacibaculum phage PTm1]BBI90629.1 hypothetical protein [Tenacibaculum phage PTm1]BBI90935.1 hypothetical protein [Tenacibaculum phage PTm5]
MESTQIVKLKNVKLSELQTAFKRSLSIGGETLNFKITPTSITNVAEHSSQSLYKKWELSLGDVCDSVDGQFRELKVAIYSGNEFVSKILGFFGQLADLEIQHENGNVNKINIIKLDEKGKRLLRIALVTASVTSSYKEIDSDMVSNIFNPDMETKASLILSPDDLKQLNNLAKLTTNPEEQTNYITIKSENGQLVATDGAFDIALRDRTEELDAIEIDKELFSCIEHENYTASVYDLGESGMLLLNSENSNSQIAVVLLSDADDSVSWDDFETDTNWDN